MEYPTPKRQPRIRTCTRCGEAFTLSPQTLPNQITKGFCAPCIAELLRDMLKKDQP